MNGADVLVTKRGNRFVQFAAQGTHGMRAEAVSNAYLTAKLQLSRESYARMQTRGWSLPTHDATIEDEQHPIDGSSNFYIDASRPVPYEALAKLAVRTLREIHRVAHPGRLEYRAFTTEGTSIRIPGLKIRRVAEPLAPKGAPHNVEHVSAATAGAPLVWKAAQHPDESFARVCDAEDPVARVDGTGFGEALGYARLMASAPALQDAARAALEALRAIHIIEEGTAGHVAGQAIPGLELALHAAAGPPEASKAVM